MNSWLKIKNISTLWRIHIDAYRWMHWRRKKHDCFFVLLPCLSTALTRGATKQGSYLEYIKWMNTTIYKTTERCDKTIKYHCCFVVLRCLPTLVGKHHNPIGFFFDQGRCSCVQWRFDQSSLRSILTRWRSNWNIHGETWCRSGRNQIAKLF